MAKKKKKNKRSTKIWDLYDGGKHKNQMCPKCGPGNFMAEHKDRKTCGKCGYMEKK